MRKVKKKNILNRIDDNINDKLDELKEKNHKNKHKQIIDEDIADDEINDFESEEDTFSEISIQKNEPKKKLNFKKMLKKKEKKVIEPVDEEILEEKIDEIKATQKVSKKKFSFKKIFKKNEKKVIADETEPEILKEEKRSNKKKDKVEIHSFEDEMNEEEIIDMKRKRKEKKKLFSGLNNKNNYRKEKNNHKKIRDNQKVPKEKKKKKRPIWKKVLTIILIIGIIGILSVTAFLGYVVITAPEFSESALAIKDQTVIYDIDGNIIAKLGTQKRESITYDQLPQVLIDAIIATEDSRFFQHNGVDLFRFIKATIQQMLGQDDAGGASTLTMQTVKNNLTKKEKTNEGKIEKIIRKFQDVYLAVFKVEKKYSKEEIIEMYVNDNGLGSSYYGVEEASKYYFGKSASELTLPEASLIAGLFQAPNRHNPYKDIKSATNRRTTVLKLMKKHGYITEEERKLAEKIPIESLLVGNNSDNTKYQGFVDTVAIEVEELTGEDPAIVPMKIYTTMERSIQDGVDTVLANDDWYWKDEKVQAGIAIVNAETGAIAAVGTGRHRTGERQFNYATMAYRQPGSTAKPIFDYGPAIEYLNYSTSTLILDERWSYTNGPNVNNWDGGYVGLKTVRYHLQYSRNVPALKTFQAVGPKNSQKFASALGLDVSLNSSSDNYHVFENGLDNTINEAYSIGGAAKGFTPLEMATAYSCFANGGYYTTPHTITKIIYRETGEEKEFKYSKERVMKESTAYIMNNILESAVTGGFNGGANVYGSHVAAKTGTSNYDEATMKAKGLPWNAVNDLWTVAYTSQYSIAVWYGYDEADPVYHNDRGDVKDALTRAIMHYIPKDTKGWSMPSSVVAVAIESETVPAALPSEYTPSDMKETGYFVRGTQPTEVSERYQKLNDIKNQKTTKNGNSVTITWDYDTPKVLTKEYIQSYYNKSTFGNSKNAYVEKRLNYNSNTLGDVGFAIYRKDNNDALTLIDFVTDKSYTYKGYGNATLVIKAEHKNFKSNASNGVTIPISLEEFNVNDIAVTYDTPGNIQANVGEYVEKGFKTITYKQKDISSNVTIRYSINTDTDTDTYATAADFEKVINTLDAGTYTITYKIYYLDNQIIKTRTLILK